MVAATPPESQSSPDIPPPHPRTTARQYIGGVVAMIIMMLGTALITLGNLGTAPVSSPVYVASLIGGPTFGGWTFILNLVLIVGQLVLLRGAFPKVGWLQIPLLLLGSAVLDGWMWLLKGLSADVYVFSLVLVAIGIIVLGFGVSLLAAADTLYMPGEGFVSAVAVVASKPFPRIKLIFDISCVSIAVIMTLFAFHGLHGVREGTILSALSLGPVVGIFLPLSKKLVGKRYPKA